MVNRHVRIEPHQAEIFAGSDTLVVKSDEPIQPGSTLQLHGYAFKVVGSEPLSGWGRFNQRLHIRGRHVDSLRELMTYHADR